MVEPVAGSPSWHSTSGTDFPTDGLSHTRSPEVENLHRTFWRYLVGEGEERAGSPYDQRQGDSEPMEAADLESLAATVADAQAPDVQRVAAGYAIGRSQCADTAASPRHFHRETV